MTRRCCSMLKMGSLRACGRTTEGRSGMLGSLAGVKEVDGGCNECCSTSTYTPSSLTVDARSTYVSLDTSSFRIETNMDANDFTFLIRTSVPV